MVSWFLATSHLQKLAELVLKRTVFAVLTIPIITTSTLCHLCNVIYSKMADFFFQSQG